jgi:glycosyltransferase involved in cell wall biosynthesis
MGRATDLSVGLDAHHLARSEGNRTYVLNLLAGFARTGVLAGGPRVLVHAPESLVACVPPGPGLEVRPVPDALFGRAITRVPLVSWLQRRERLDLWHAAWFAPPGPARLVLTVHDVLFATRPELFGRLQGLRLRTLVPRALARAARIVVSSRATLDALVATYPRVAPAVRLVRFGIDLARFRPEPEADDDAQRRAAGLPPGRDYVLSVGRPDRRKDLPGLMAALATARPQATDPLLVLAGPHREAAPRLHAAVRRAGLSPGRVVIVSDPDEARLAALYRGCATFAFPSLAEGVGVPVLEALACGAPVVCTTDPALVEVAGGAALLVAPGDRAALAAALDAALSGCRPDVAGPAVARAWSLEEMAIGTARVYREALGS